MSEITAIIIDSREPDWIRNLKFGGIPTSVTTLETGDIQAVTSDGHILVFERKTTSDFLNSLRDERLFPQLARMAEVRVAQQIAGEPLTYWPYILITGQFLAGQNGKVVIDRGETGWSHAAIEGTLLSIQELGIFVAFANGDLDFENAILRIGRRSRNSHINIMPPRPANVLGPKAAFLSSLPGIGIDRVQEILDWSNHNVAHALIGLTDMDIKSPITLAVRRRVRDLIGLHDGENLEITGVQPIAPVQGELGKDYLLKEM